MRQWLEARMLQALIQQYRVFILNDRLLAHALLLGWHSSTRKLRSIYASSSLVSPNTRRHNFATLFTYVGRYDYYVLAHLR